jgi:hypothetical protein
VFEATFGASLAKEVLGDVEASCRLRGSEQVVVPAFMERSLPTADHGLTKTLVLG